jgi:signal transduction histidine kinase
VAYLLAYWVDITDNKMAEERMEKDIDRLNTVRRQHLEEIIQRLRNSLTGLRGYLDSLLTSDFEWDRRQQTEFLKEAVVESDHLESIIEDLAAIDMIESGNLNLDQKVYSVAELLSDAGTRLQARAKSHKLSVKIVPNLPEIYIDETRVIRVLADLIEDTAKTTPAGGRIEITAGKSPEGVEISIVSAGPGGSQESPEAMGLVWELALKVIAAHGGKIELETAPGKARRISFTLPAVREA